MTVEFRLTPHTLRNDALVVEIWENGEFIGAIYPRDNGLIAVISKFGAQSRLIEGQFPTLEVQIGK